MEIEQNNKQAASAPPKPPEGGLSELKPPFGGFRGREPRQFLEEAIGGKITMLTGGSRSGKSSYALELAEKNYSKRAFIATAIAFDDEMTDRIARHKLERLDRYATIEEPYDLIGAIKNIDDTVQVCIIDCLTVWLGNCFYKNGDLQAPVEKCVDGLVEFLLQPRKTDLIFVTNEVGWGIIPENKLARLFKDTQGICNKKMAALAQEVYLSVCGISFKIKG